MPDKTDITMPANVVIIYFFILFTDILLLKLHIKVLKVYERQSYQTTIAFLVFMIIFYGF